MISTASGARWTKPSRTPAEPDRLPHDHRLGRAQQAGHQPPRTAPRSALTKVAARRKHLVWDSEPFDLPADIVAAWRAAVPRP
jgi:hypothetical protein